MKNVDTVKTTLPFTNKELATQLANAGWKITPVLECDGGANGKLKDRKGKLRKAKVPYTTHGFKDATCDPRKIEKYWRTWPNALIGFPPGPNGLLVIDQDVKKGKEGVKAWRELSDVWQDAIGVVTPSGGIHDWYLAPDRDIGNSGGSLPKGIDVRCDNGYACLGTMADGTCYAPDGELNIYDILLEPDAESWFRPLPAEIEAMLPEEEERKTSQSGHRDPLRISYSEGFEPVTLERLCACSDSIRAWAAPDEGGRSNSDDAFDWLTKAIVGLCQALERDADAFGDDETRNLAELALKADHAFMAHYDERGPGKLGYDIAQAIAWATKEAIAFDRNRKTRHARKEQRMEKPLVSIESGFHDRIVIETEGHLLEAGADLFDRGGLLVRPVHDEMKSCKGEIVPCPAFREVTQDYMRFCVAKHISFEKYLKTEEEWVKADPPRDVTNAMLSRSGEWPFPQLAGLATAPTLRADGSVLDAPGYDPATGIYLFNEMALDMPDRPTRGDAERAADVLDGLLAEFPFVDDASYSVGMSALITPVVRPMMDVAPFHLATAPSAGSGKSYLFDVASMIALGTLCPVMSTGRTEEELEKRLGSKVLAGHPIINIDNAEIDLGGDALCQLVERPIVDLRILGKSEMPRAINRQTMFGSGNNIPLKGDMVRRSITSTMDAEMEKPHERRFKADPVAMVRADRARYVAACLTLVRAYVLAGSPKVTPTPMNSFAGWSDTVRSALIWLGYADPCETMEAARDNDPELQQLQEFMTAFADEIGTGRMNACALRDVIGNAEHLAFPKLKAALSPFVRSGNINPRAFGVWLRRSKKRIVGGLSLDNFMSSKVAKWYVLEHEK